jgi:hypothetical protein
MSRTIFKKHFTKLHHECLVMGSVISALHAAIAGTPHPYTVGVLSLIRLLAENLKRIQRRANKLEASL